MRIDDLIIDENKTVLDAMHQLNDTGRAILFVAPDSVLQGVVTDADVRRYILRGGACAGKRTGTPDSGGLQQQRL